MNDIDSCKCIGVVPMREVINWNAIVLVWPRSYHLPSQYNSNRLIFRLHPYVSCRSVRLGMIARRLAESTQHYDFLFNTFIDIKNSSQSPNPKQRPRTVNLLSSNTGTSLLGRVCWLFIVKGCSDSKLTVIFGICMSYSPSPRSPSFTTLGQSVHENGLS